MLNDRMNTVSLYLLAQASGVLAFWVLYLLIQNRYLVVQP